MTLHVGLRLMGKHDILDTLEDIRVLQKLRLYLIFFSYLWFHDTNQAQTAQWECSQTALGLYCEANGHFLDSSFCLFLDSHV